MKAEHFFNPKIFFSIMLISAASVAGAQNPGMPRNDFDLVFSNNALELSPGESAELEIRILKSKSYRKSDVKMGVSSGLPKGVAVKFNPDNGAFDSTRTSIAVGDNATPGQYLLVLTATLNNKTKGTIVKLLINKHGRATFY